MAKKPNFIAFGVQNGPAAGTLVKQELAAMGVDPIKKMAELLLESSDPEFQFAVAKELAQYVEPKLKSVDVKVASGGEGQKQLTIVRFGDVEPEKAAALEQATNQMLEARKEVVLRADLQGLPLSREDKAMLKEVAAEQTPPISGAMTEVLRREVERPVASLPVTEVVTAVLEEDDLEAAAERTQAQLEALEQRQAEHQAEGGTRWRMSPMNLAAQVGEYDPVFDVDWTKV